MARGVATVGPGRAQLLPNQRVIARTHMYIVTHARWAPADGVVVYGCYYWWKWQVPVDAYLVLQPQIVMNILAGRSCNTEKKYLQITPLLLMLLTKLLHMTRKITLLHYYLMSFFIHRV